MKTLRSLVAPLGLLVALGCSSSADKEPPPASVDTLPMPEGGLLDYSVDAAGPFNVGYRTWTYSYEAPGGAGTREILINVWYPTLDKEGAAPHYIGLFPDASSFEGASLAPPLDPAGYPVHAYSHGHAGFGATSSFLMRYFASHGWVAVAPDHKGNTLSDPKGSAPLSIHYLRSLDMAASLDSLEDLAAGDPLAGKCLTKNVVLSGHSFGTETAWSVGGATYDMAEIQAKCGSGTSFPEPCTPEQIAVFEPGLGDPRVKAGIPMAGGTGTGPGWFTEGGYDAVSKPYMLMSGTDDPVGAENVWARVTSIDFTWLDILGGCHQLFALGGCKGISDEEGFPVVSTYALAFANRFILDDKSPSVAGILDGSDTVSPKVHFYHK